MAQRSCRQCGSLYDLTEGTAPRRAAGTIDCQVCGVELVDRNSSTMYTVRLLKAEPWPKTPNPTPAPRT
jgi:hypothetical protein